MGAGLSPAALSARSLFEPLSKWLKPYDQLPDVATLDRLAAQLGRPVSGGGAPIHFVETTPQPEGYERQIFEHGQVPTRPDNWHDFYNALCWLAFPHTKAALNARHIRHLQPGTRGAVRDAATQFDECGVVVLHANPALAQALQSHEWVTAFWAERDALCAQMRFLIVGHALYERLATPHVGLCGKAVYLDVPQAVIDSPLDQQMQIADSCLSAQLADDTFAPHPRDFHPLPLLGIPGVTSDNEAEDYYRDARQFRPHRSRA